ncbi:hypothetical protein Desdi_0817 [Desulfitobacterium dichloroeliminans LMG P-21439]|uniref:Adenylate kinase n=1 Tax=Desulfitobacterium dichloroeliminans (strain LMG P-21439 / DCA1) TaxID=871963 RepID=L0F577_DESDL|nr:ATP-binding protein [Desulfitobacterium dichloroeliminans]AGA68342.1 hypothetical protein Desdi_0817 [Desulfitobacterium dichloroeliminans LMG P-21439]
MKRIIFVGGIHGVGKTYFCNNLLDNYRLKSYSASELISRVKEQILGSEKSVQDIMQNQDILINAVKDLDDTDSYIILDGHFCLLNKDSNVERVPDKVFNELPLVAIIVLNDDVDNIIGRLRERDNVIYPKALLRRFQEEELKYSLKVSEQLKIPYLSFGNSEDSTKVYKFLDSIIN